MKSTYFLLIAGMLFTTACSSKQSEKDAESARVVDGAGYFYNNQSENNSVESPSFSNKTTATETVSPTSEKSTTSKAPRIDSYRGDDVDEMYEGVADDAKADLRKACREAGVDYDELFDDADIDRQVEELKEETRRQMREMGY